MSIRAAVIGHPVSQSLSPVIHRAAFAELGIDWTYDAIDCGVDGLPGLFAAVRAGGWGGLSVTMPLKDAVIAHMDRIDTAAAAMRAVNCISVSPDGLCGHNTDGDGCCDALEAAAGRSPQGETAVVLGAGGTARSVALALVSRGASVVIVNRTRSNADALVRMVSEASGSPAGIRVGDADDVRSAGILVNTTSVGMGSDEIAIPAPVLHERLAVLDAVYSPLDTALLRAARTAGAVTVDGLWMLIHQAARQQMHWFGRSADAALMREESVRELARRGG